MYAAELREIAETEWVSSAYWWKQAAAQAWDEGHVCLISSPTDHSIYLARFWLNRPVRDEAGEWESENSTLVHFFVRPDHDRALHNHPWKFKTSILQGGYMERLPPEDWAVGSKKGPPADHHFLWRNAGETILHEATDLHCVGAIKDNTWTLVSTGPRIQEWGFHPEGKSFILSDKYLDHSRPSILTARKPIRTIVKRAKKAKTAKKA